ncbi:ribosome biogenesis GTPase [Keratinibaculum paraultunense]|uniref:Small ribosomal subunit biogenesis GTPase RsgA n=1 Tax=Keratinibaculum paraultunense TaxID=1278232 RepID=A0A4R3KWT5_9FIRM|nr:ribosome small subunit-dependent GTPase A [Keratinibaculum paraultunense]QQY80782.1 ribosome small subunit-dependent GTPase A [Keratinibaculum paraultunense]TCS89606.1 ribosome biogenesis GTPase [Keratinibaculum paraultunense]
MLSGRIIKGIGGFYYVETERGIYECKARGLFRKHNTIPLVGDKVLIRVNEEDETGYIEKIMDRSSQLTRPPVANITQAIIVMSVKEPDINFWLLDRFLVMVEYEKLDTIICINKIDLAKDEELEFINIYSKAGYSTIMASAKTGDGIEELREKLKNNITVFAGPSGVGKSSLLNKIDKRLGLKTGEISKKTTRGKHTTRHVELIDIGFNSYVLDTPGFSSLDLSFVEEEVQLGSYFREIDKYSYKCKFSGCLHYKEPGCEVKKQMELGNIDKVRYKNYISFLEEIRNTRRY